MGFFDSFSKAYNKENSRQREVLETLEEKHNEEKKRFERYNKMSNSELSNQLKNFFLSGKDAETIKKILSSRNNRK